MQAMKEQSSPMADGGTSSETILKDIFARLEPHGAVPLTDGDHAAPSASDAARRVKRRVNVLSTANLLSEVALVAVNSALAQEGFRRPPARRFVPRWGRL